MLHTFSWLSLYAFWLTNAWISVGCLDAKNALTVNTRSLSHCACPAGIHPCCRRPVHDHHLNVLAERLPRLHMLIIVGCPVLYTEVQALQRRFPELIIHRKPLLDISCSSSDHDGSGG